MKHRFTSLLLAVALLGGPAAGTSLLGTANAFPPAADLPSAITSNATAMVFYIYGVLEARDELAGLMVDGKVAGLDLLATNSLTAANMFRQYSNPIMFAYLLGRADAFAEAAAQIELDGAP